MSFTCCRNLYLYFTLTKRQGKGKVAPVSKRYVIKT